ncbi:hypothetical protein [Bacillus sp. FJAT-45350]|uniref:YqgU-like beta propeller domain-containing protein n=1 Tax=Bacillus sp. FJAT-45350 TaxID=2011014 RepID=UPI000BB7CB53|nr:hypothetical protein [Bacillus sp. FJAT-45350]
MIKAFVFLIIILFLFTACQPSTEVRPMPAYEHVIVKEKIAFAPSFKQDIHTLNVNPYSFVEVSEWYSDRELLYLKDENGLSIIQRFDLYTGDNTIFFEVDEPVLYVEANKDYSLFAIQTISLESEKSPLYIVDSEGQVRYQFDDIGEDYTIYWSQYEEDELLIVAFLPNWEYYVYHLSIGEQSLAQLEIEQTYFQWLTEDEVGFLDWPYEPSYYAPLVSYNIHTKEKQKVDDEILAFLSFQNDKYVTVKVNSPTDEHSIYRFYEKGEKINETKVPVLNTFSEQWWVPFHAYSDNLFYYLRPFRSGDFFNYRDGYTLVSFNITTGQEEKIIVVDNHAPIKISPNGDWILYGHKSEQIINVKNKLMKKLVNM